MEEFNELLDSLVDWKWLVPAEDRVTDHEKTSSKVLREALYVSYLECFERTHLFHLLEGGWKDQALSQAGSLTIIACSRSVSRPNSSLQASFDPPVYEEVYRRNASIFFDPI